MTEDQCQWVESRLVLLASVEEIHEFIAIAPPIHEVEFDLTTLAHSGTEPP